MTGVPGCLPAPAHDGTPGYLHPAAEYVWGDVPTPRWPPVAAASSSATRFDGGLSTSPTSASTAGTTTSAPPAAGLHATGFQGRFVLASSMVVYGEGRYTCADHGLVPAPPRRAADSRPAGGALVSPLRRAAAPRHRPRGRPRRPRNAYAATKFSTQEHLVRCFEREHPGIWSRRRCATTTSTAPGCHGTRPTPGWVSIFRSALSRDGRGCSRTAASGAISCTSPTSPANVAALTTPDVTSYRVQRGQRRPHTVGEMAVALAAAFGLDRTRLEVVGGYRLGDVRHVVASLPAGRGRARVPGRGRLRGGHGRIAHAPLR